MATETPETQVRRGLRAADGAYRHSTLQRILAWTLGAIVFGLCLFSVLSAVQARTGLTATVLGGVTSLLVIGIVVPIFFWLDRFEPEPNGLRIFCFLWGACVATLGAAFFNELGGYLLGGTDRNVDVAVAVAPWVEEILKGVAPLLLLIFRRKEIDGMLDGIVYAGLSAAGFATVEDIVYLANGFADAGDSGILGLFVVRVLMMPFAHPFFTLWIGVGVGIAATRTGVLRRTLPLLIGFAVAVALHAGWNAVAVLAATGVVLPWILVQVPVFVGFVLVLRWARRWEADKVSAQLSAYNDDGWLTEPEVRMLSSIADRRYARAWARSHGGRRMERQMVHLQDITAELAMLRARMQRGDVASDAPKREERMLLAVAHLREPFLDTALYRYYEWTEGDGDRRGRRNR